MKFEDAKTLVLEKLRSQRLTSHGVLDLQRRVKSVDSEGEDAQWDNPIPGGEDADTQYMTIGMLLDVFDAFVKDDAGALDGVTLLNLVHCFLHDSDVPLLTDLFTYKMLPNCKTLILHDSSLSRVSVAELLALLSYLDVLDVSNTTLALWTRSWNVRKALVEQNMLHKYIWVNGPAALVTLRWVDAVPKGRRGVVRDAHLAYFQTLRVKGLIESVGEDYSSAFGRRPPVDLSTHPCSLFLSAAGPPERTIAHTNEQLEDV